MIMIYTGDKITGTANTIMVCVQLRVSKKKHVKVFPIQVYKPPEFSSQLC